MTEHFSELSFQEQVDKVNIRLGAEHVDRIETPEELLKLTDESIFVVLSPFGQEQENTGNGFVFEWVVGKIITDDFDEITTFDNIVIDDDTKYVCVHKDVDRYKSDFKAINIKDFNIIPNTFNNHAAFTTLEGARSYVMFRKLQWKEDEVIIQLIGEYDYWMSKEQIIKEDLEIC